MITAALSEPSNIFDGKIGILCHGNIVPAQRNSVRRPAGTLEIQSKIVDSVEFYDSQTKVHRDLEIIGILDMIVRAKEPETMTWIQMECNTPAHGKRTQLLQIITNVQNMMVIIVIKVHMLE